METLEIKVAKFPALEPIANAIISAKNNAGLSSGQVGIYRKEDGSLVTDTDSRVQDYLASVLAGVYEGQGLSFVMEEKDTENAAAYPFVERAEVTVYLDPLDGTSSYVKGTGNWAISVGIRSDHSALGIIQPAKGSMLIGYQGEDGNNIYTWRNGRIVEIGPTTLHTDQWRVAAHYNHQSIETLRRIYSILKGSPVVDPRSFGDAPQPGSLAADITGLVTGKYNLVVNGGCYPWDIAAAQTIIASGGHKIMDWEGNEINLAKLNDPRQMLRIVAGSPENITRFYDQVYG